MRFFKVSLAKLTIGVKAKIDKIPQVLQGDVWEGKVQNRRAGETRPYRCIDGGRMGASAPTGCVLGKNIVGAGVPTGPHAGTDGRRVRDAAPYGGAGSPFACQCAAARG